MLGCLFICLSVFLWVSVLTVPDSKVHGANMGPIWGWQGSGGPHVGPINFAIWGVIIGSCQRWWTSHMATEQFWLHCTQSTSSIGLIMQTYPWSCLDKSTQYSYVNVIASFPCFAALCPQWLWAQIVDQGLISPMVFPSQLQYYENPIMGRIQVNTKICIRYESSAFPWFRIAVENFPNFELWYKNH